MVLPILIAGGGIAGLAAALSFQRLGFEVIVYDKVSSFFLVLRNLMHKARVLRDAGSGMSVIGHSLVLLQSLGVDLRALGLRSRSASCPSPQVMLKMTYPCVLTQVI